MELQRFVPCFVLQAPSLCVLEVVYKILSSKEEDFPANETLNSVTTDAATASAHRRRNQEILHTTTQPREQEQAAHKQTHPQRNLTGVLYACVLLQFPSIDFMECRIRLHCNAEMRKDT
jgi:hypothetical protein